MRRKDLDGIANISLTLAVQLSGQDPRKALTRAL